MSRTCLILLALLLGASGSASALTTRCVDSVIELDAAVRLADADDVRINIVQGSYNISGTALDHSQGFDIEASIELVGGYSADCDSASENPASTILFAQERIFSIDDGGDIRLVSLTLRDFDRIFLHATSSGIAPADHDVRLKRVRVLHSGYAQVRATRVFVQSSEFVSGITGDVSGGCALSILTYGMDRALIENSTIAHNPRDGLCIGYATLDDDDVWGSIGIHNSVLWNPGHVDLRLSQPLGQSAVNVTQHSVLLYNRLITPASFPPPVAEINLDPRFVDPAGGNFRLRDDSPAKDSGTTDLPSGIPGSDIRGLERVVNGNIDRGASENPSGGSQLIYTVTNTANAGAGSLRQALVDAQNNPGPNGIRFAIPGAGCPRVIEVLSALPVITEDLVIDGLSQPGSSGNSSEVRFNGELCVVLHDAAGNIGAGLAVGAAAPEDASVRISGLGFSGFGVGIDLQGGAEHGIYGNQFGGAVGAFSLAPNANGIRAVRHDDPPLTGLQIGGEDTNLRNLVGGNTSVGVRLVGAAITGARISNNFIGLDATGSGADPNQYGILVSDAVGTEISDNWISGNDVDGVYLLNASETLVQGNDIGRRSVPDLFGVLGSALGNGGWGIRASYAPGELSGNTLGTGIWDFLGFQIPIGRGNHIAHNGSGGIRIAGGLGHRIGGNLIHDHTGPSIDVGEAGFDLNDDDCLYIGFCTSLGLPNRGLNSPEIASARGGPDQGLVSGTLTSLPGEYRIEIYGGIDCSGFLEFVGDARRFLGWAQVSIEGDADGTGTADFTAAIERSGSIVFDHQLGVVALAIDAEGNTSELSFCRAYAESGELFRDGFE